MHPDPEQCSSDPALAGLPFLLARGVVLTGDGFNVDTKKTVIRQVGVRVYTTAGRRGEDCTDVRVIIIIIACLLFTNRVPALQCACTQNTHTFMHTSLCAYIQPKEEEAVEVNADKSSKHGVTHATFGSS